MNQAYEVGLGGNDSRAPKENPVVAMAPKHRVSSNVYANGSN
jgi:hypothetical protein